MPKIKIPRKNIALDMTAMCDMAFLLLTFFMLSTQFKADQSEVVDIPASVSEIKFPEKDMFVIAVQSKGQVFVGLDNQHTKEALIEKITTHYKIPLSDQDKKEFSLLASFGTPVEGLKSFLRLEPGARKKVAQEGIPCDSANNQLREWVRLARLSNPKIKIAIKGDREADYKTVKTVIATLQEQNINKFNLITNLRKKPGNI